MRLAHREIDPPDLTTYESYSEFPQEIESDSDTEVILGPPRHQTKINTPERNWEETPPVTEGDAHLPGTNPLRDHSPSTNPLGTHSPRIAAKFPHPYHRAVLHTSRTLIHLDHTYCTDRTPHPHRAHQIDQTRQNQGLIHPQGTIQHRHTPLTILTHPPKCLQTRNTQTP